jgi:hypothetical protein
MNTPVTSRLLILNAVEGSIFRTSSTVDFRYKLYMFEWHLAFVCCEVVFRFVTSKLEMCTHPFIIIDRARFTIHMNEGIQIVLLVQKHLIVGVYEGGNDSYLLTQPCCCFTSEIPVWYTTKWVVPKILAVISSLSSIWSVKVFHKENTEGLESRYTDCVYCWIICSKYVFVGVLTWEIQYRCIFCEFEVVWYKKYQLSLILK